VGIDLGVENLVATSDGKLIVGGQFGSRAKSQLPFAQQKLARQRRGSKRRQIQLARIAQVHRKIANQRLNASHQLSRQLVNEYDFVAMENLAIKNMVRAPKAKLDPEQPGSYLPNGATAKAALNRSIHDAGWGQVTSRGERNELGNFLCWHLKAKGLSRPAVQASLDLHEVFG
jgi:putative transposase